MNTDEIDRSSDRGDSPSTRHDRSKAPRRRTRAPRRDITGILVVDKPSDWTSHDVVAKVRNTFTLKKLGHAGTLDPIATGVLVLLAGRATKCSNTLSADEKEYRFTLRFGLTTDTQDISGETIDENPARPSRSVEEIEAVLQDYRGDISQLPPMFSAVKVKGTRLYKLGRKGKVVEREPREVSIHELVLESVDWPNATLRAVCSKGTYIRTLCHDIGRDLGPGGCMASLVRLRSGQFTLGDAHTLDTVLTWPPEELTSRLLPLPD